MTMTYTPTPRQQQSYTEPAGGGAKDVASVTVMLEALADAIARLSFEAFQWGPSASNTRNIKRGTYSAKEQSWYAVGNGGNDFCERSQDGGRSWVDLTGTVGLTGVHAIYDIKANAAGDIVMVTQARNVYSASYAGSGYGGLTFTDTANALSHTLSDGGIDYDEQNALWVVVFRNAANGMKANTSPDRTTYTDRSANLPAAWTAYTGSQEPAVACNLVGKTLAVFFDDSGATNKYRTATSSNGGINWTATTQGGGAFAGAFNAETVGKPTYDAKLGDWYFVAGRTTGTDSTEVFRSSDDGATWTSVFSDTTSNVALQDIVAINGVLLGVNVDGRIFTSVDRGVTWKLAGRNPIASAARPYMRAGNGQVMVWNSADKTSFATLRLGAEGS